MAKEEKPIKEYIFVYGTLMSGFGNHVLLNTSTKICDGETAEKYALYINGIPFVNESIPVSTIKGEVWEVTERNVIRNIDGLEGHPDWYYRKIIDIDGYDGNKYKCWIYFNNFNNNNFLQEHGSYKQSIEEKKAYLKRVILSKDQE